MHAKEKASQLRWIGYLSSTSVYGDWGGAWVDERSSSPIYSHSARYTQSAIDVKLCRAIAEHNMLFDVL